MVAMVAIAAMAGWDSNDVISRRAALLRDSKGLQGHQCMNLCLVPLHPSMEKRDVAFFFIAYSAIGPSSQSCQTFPESLLVPKTYIIVITVFPWIILVYS